MKKIYYIMVDHYWIDENGKETNRSGDPACIDGYRLGFEDLEEAKKALLDIKNKRLSNPLNAIGGPEQMIYDSDIIVVFESKYAGTRLHIEWLWIK